MNVTYITTSTEDVTENYLSVEAKIESLEAQRKGLVEMLESVDLFMEDFEKTYSVEKRADAIRYAKDLKDRYSVLWTYEQIKGPGHKEPPR